jgi:hypothetical protein
MTVIPCRLVLVTGVSVECRPCGQFLFSEFIIIIIYYYYYHYLLQLSFNSVAVVLTLVSSPYTSQ